MLHARNRGVETMFIHALSENTAMLKIARNAGATSSAKAPESEAWLKLPPDSLASHLDELLERAGRRARLPAEGAGAPPGSRRSRRRRKAATRRRVAPRREP